MCSVGWSARGSCLAVGTGSGGVQLWDVARGACVRAHGGHRARVGALAWAGRALATGSRDRSILLRDPRAAGDYTSKLAAHKSEVCGLRWSPDERALASGGNDNALLAWCPRRPAPVHTFTDHTAAVKAIAWSPHQVGPKGGAGWRGDGCRRRRARGGRCGGQEGLPAGRWDGPWDGRRATSLPPTRRYYPPHPPPSSARPAGVGRGHGGQVHPVLEHGDG